MGRLDLLPSRARHGRAKQQMQYIYDALLPGPPSNCPCLDVSPHESRPTATWMDVNKQDEAVSLALHAIQTSHSWKSLSHTSDRVGGDEIDVILHHPPTLSTRSPVHFVLGNFFFATASISLIIIIIFLGVTWFTVLHDTRSVNDWVLSNVTGVSMRVHYNEQPSLMTAAEVGVDNRPWSSTGPRHKCIIHFMEGCRLQYERHFR